MVVHCSSFCDAGALRLHGTPSYGFWFYLFESQPKGRNSEAAPVTSSGLHTLRHPPDALGSPLLGLSHWALYLPTPDA